VDKTLLVKNINLHMIKPPKSLPGLCWLIWRQLLSWLAFGLNRLL